MNQAKAMYKLCLDFRGRIFQMKLMRVLNGTLKCLQRGLADIVKIGGSTV